jgi:hypothetical protein
MKLTLQGHTTLSCLAQVSQKYNVSPTACKSFFCLQSDTLYVILRPGKWACCILLFKIPSFLLLLIPLTYSIIIHEVAHGWVAYKMGDPTARWMGRLTLTLGNIWTPGTIMLFIFGFGWAKPVPVNFNNLSDLRKGLIFVSAAGITANILLASPRDASADPSSAVRPGNHHAYFSRTHQHRTRRLQSDPIPPLDGAKSLWASPHGSFNIPFPDSSRTACSSS